MLNLDKYEIWIDENGDVWAESDEEDWDASNFIWDEESGQLVFSDIPVKTFTMDANGVWHLNESLEDANV